MPIIGLPNILENSLNNILDSMDISSWNIKGENDSMQVIIRFKMAAVDESCSNRHSNITYRKLPPSQVQRDKNRAKEWRNEQTKFHQPTFDEHITENSCNANTENAFNCPNQLVYNTVDDTAQPSPIPNQVDGMNDPYGIPTQGSAAAGMIGDSTAAGQYDMDMTDVNNSEQSFESHKSLVDCKDEPCKSVCRKEPFMIPHDGKRLPAQCKECNHVYTSKEDKTYFCFSCNGFICKGKCFKAHADHDGDMTCLSRKLSTYRD